MPEDRSLSVWEKGVNIESVGQEFGLVSLLGVTFWGLKQTDSIVNGRLAALADERLIGVRLSRTELNSLIGNFTLALAGKPKVRLAYTHVHAHT